MNNILVIGSNGFIGKNICRLLAVAGYNVFAADIADTPSHAYQNSYKQLNVITDSFANIIKEIDCVIYLVSTLLPDPSNRNITKDINENLIPVINLLEQMCVTGKCKKIIFSSSGGTIYGVHEEKITESSFLDPKCSYGIMKLTVEKYLSLYSDLYGIQTISLRLSNPYGIGQDFNKPQGAVGIFLHKMLNNTPIEIWGDGKVIRDYIYIDDVVSAFIASIQYSGKSDIFNIGSGTGTSLNDLLDMLFKITNSRSIVAYAKSRNVDVPCNILEIEKARRQLGWEPTTTLQDGLVKLISSMC